MALADALGADRAGLKDFVADVLGVVDTATFGLLDLAEHLTFDLVLTFAHKTAMDAVKHIGIGIVEILGLLQLDPLETLVALVQKVAKLVLEPFGVELPFPYRLEGKPALEARAFAIGAARAAQGYDVIALSEVWDQSPTAREATREAIKATLAAGSKAITGEAIGPRNESQLLDSGLYRLWMGERSIVGEPERKAFDDGGDRLIDTDAWATKGILLTRIQVGAGVIDLYNMHLIFGADSSVRSSG